MKIEAVEHILRMKRTANRAASCDYDYQEAAGQFYAGCIRIALDNAEDDYGRVIEIPITRPELGPFATIIDEIRGDGLFRIKVVDLV
ncbi:hypothetical protein [Brucella intermedia]|uniref:hypothetical protein n=1 Tax=Brucella intermedia TaxID=94625 RepID=UPI00124F3B59|nr:hypothetical protein [Brucella intermedia]KAB2722411.1 hypothetical protein F9L02_22790 [Brucella intermedia]